MAFNADKESFQDEFAKAQSVLLGGAVPCLYTAESKVEPLVFDEVAAVTAVPSRSSRSTTTTNTSQTSATNSSTATTAGSESEYVDAINVQRTLFILSYGEFSDYLVTVGKKPPPTPTRQPSSPR